MADFEPPFADGNENRRFPTADEIENGFPCGDADINLFNGLFWCIQKEIVEVIKAGNLVPSNGSHTQLRDAILSMIPNFVNTNTFISSINGDSNGGPVNVNANNQIVIARSDGRTWTINLPEAPEPRPAMDYFTTPVTILNVSQTKAAGNFDTGNVNLNLNSLSGVTVPSGATGVVIQAATGINGNQERPGESSSVTDGFAWIQAGGTLSNINATTVAQIPNMVSYVDTNLGANDNDDTSYPMIKLNGNNLAYRARVRWANTNGVDTARLVIRLVAFTF